MCGIFGIIGKTEISKSSYLQKEIETLFLLSESRGKEASGIAISNNKEIHVLKRDIPASILIREKQFLDLFKSMISEDNIVKFEIIGHSRLVTTGSEEKDDNNQPIIKNNNIAIHNGIITNFEELFSDNSDLEKLYEVDTEIIPSLFSKYLTEGNTVLEIINKIYSQIEGAASVCLLNSEYDLSVLATNNGSLYFNIEENMLVFSSERYILERYLDKSKLFDNKTAKQLIPNDCLIYDGEISHLKEINIDSSQNVITKLVDRKREIINHNSPKHSKKISDVFHILKEDVFEDATQQISKLKRCNKCVLPETFPFIEFDKEGICNYCLNYKKKFTLSEEENAKKENELFSIVDKYRRANAYDVIVPFSGGRDSSYGLDYIKKKLKLNPVTFTYDWGMITDLARRNISRICGNLGIENILVSADIRKKREYIRKNVTAWLKKPELGMIPLFMAGDKQFFRIVNLLKEQNNVSLNIWMTNPLENTDFKTGFAGIKPNFSKDRIYDLNTSEKAKLILYYSRNFLTNFSYINSSLPDTISAFFSYYTSKREDYVHLFKYLSWQEENIESYLISEYNWELAKDTKSSWRIGDGTASFYNYIYNTVAGFTENDTFRSNQIREGMITREFALNKILEENKPRHESLIWYFDVLKMDCTEAIKTINKIQRLY